MEVMMVEQDIPNDFLPQAANEFRLFAHHDLPETAVGAFPLRLRCLAASAVAKTIDDLGRRNVPHGRDFGGKNEEKTTKNLATENIYALTLNFGLSLWVWFLTADEMVNQSRKVLSKRKAGRLLQKKKGFCRFQVP